MRAAVTPNSLSPRDEPTAVDLSPGRPYIAASRRASRPPAFPRGSGMDREHRLRRLRFRAWHRGTKEADLMVGGFFDRASPGWNDEEVAWFEALMEEQDVDIMAWAMGVEPWPPRMAGPLADAMRRLDYLPVAG